MMHFYDASYSLLMKNVQMLVKITFKIHSQLQIYSICRLSSELPRTLRSVKEKQIKYPLSLEGNAVRAYILDYVSKWVCNVGTSMPKNDQKSTVSLHFLPSRGALFTTEPVETFQRSLLMMAYWSIWGVVPGLRSRILK